MTRLSDFRSGRRPSVPGRGDSAARRAYRGTSSAPSWTKSPFVIIASVLGVVVLVIVLIAGLSSRHAAPDVAAQPQADVDLASLSTPELIKRADTRHQQALVLKDKAGPDAPPDQRDAATEAWIKVLEDAKRCYEAALDRQISDTLRARIEKDLHDVQLMLYGARKFRVIK